MISEGFAQWTDQFYQGQREWAECFEPITKVRLSFLKCSSVALVNSVFEEVACSIDENEGIKSLEIVDHNTKHGLDWWPLSQIVTKAPNCQELTIRDLKYTSEENRSILLEFAGQICTVSNSLTLLSLWNTCSSAQDGDALM